MLYAEFGWNWPKYENIIKAFKLRITLHTDRCIDDQPMGIWASENLTSAFNSNELHINCLYMYNSFSEPKITNLLLE